MGGISWITYKGKKILYTDYGHSHEENIKLLEEQGKYEQNDPGLLIISDYNATMASKEYMQKVKEYGTKFRKNKNTNVKNAVLGISGTKKILFDSYLFFTNDKRTKLFKTVEDAKEWLVSE